MLSAYVSHHFLDLFSECFCQSCDTTAPLIGGFDNAVVADASLTSSSDFNSQTRAVFSRLDTPRVAGRNAGGWAARSGRLDREWIQVDLERVKVVVSVTTQGRADADQYLTQYTVLHSLDGTNYVTVANANGTGDMIFSGNQDRNSLVTNVLPVPIVTRFVRIRPTQRVRWIAMRWELSGCDYSKLTSQFVVLLIMIDVHN